MESSFGGLWFKNSGQNGRGFVLTAFILQLLGQARVCLTSEFGWCESGFLNFGAHQLTTMSLLEKVVRGKCEF